MTAIGVQFDKIARRWVCPFSVSDGLAMASRNAWRFRLFRRRVPITFMNSRMRRWTISEDRCLADAITYLQHVHGPGQADRPACALMNPENVAGCRESAVLSVDSTSSAASATIDGRRHAEEA